MTMTKTKRRNSTPQFCIITPTHYLQQYATQSDMHLVLAHLVDMNHEYAEFYANCEEFKIMDNGAFELGRSYNPSKLIDLAELCKAHAIVLPDYPGQDANKTISAAMKLHPQVHEAGFYTFFCPQAKVGDMEGWINSYRWAADNDFIDIIGMSILAVPNALPHIPAAYARVVMTQLLIDRGIFNSDKYHHYLGLNAGPKLEIPPLLRMGALDSCDSSNPVWAGINGVRYDITTDSYLPTRKEFLGEVDFSIKPTKKECILEAIQYNVDLTLGLFE